MRAGTQSMPRGARSVLVLGLGVSGQAAAARALAENRRVTVVDARNAPRLQARARRLRRRGARVRLGVRSIPWTAGGKAGFDLCVCSPGIASDAPWPRAVRRRGIRIMAELELGARGLRSPMLAVTGTNGKSTFVKLCVEAFGRGGLRAEAAGNCGRPLSSAGGGDPLPDWMVVEVSSFQLECVETFAPRVAVLLNVQPDHLDRHGSMERYAALKGRIFANLRQGDTAVVRDAELERMGPCLPKRCAVRTFGVSESAQYRYSNGVVRCSDWESGFELNLNGSRFDNPVTGETAAAAAAALDACALQRGALQAAIRDYEPLPHRMQEVIRVSGVRFVDDSKATNLSALAAAVAVQNTPVRLIAGGILKGEKLPEAKKVLTGRVRGVYVIGTSSEDMVRAWGGEVACVRCGDLGTAVRRAWRDASPGETVLLSPGCASFDQFENYAERGRRFAEIVRSLTS